MVDSFNYNKDFGNWDVSEKFQSKKYRRCPKWATVHLVASEARDEAAELVRACQIKKKGERNSRMDDS